ncbi:FecR family protein [Aquimarina sp. 2-A2]|uniref:FecR family protein n=1 Tax=Aquimarina sp. 2-A2 TaxID=3382644 RepID=UPI00387F21D8
MKKEELIIKWLEGELSEEELQEFKKLEEYDSYQKLYEHAEFFESPLKVNEEKGFVDLRSRLDNATTNGTARSWMYPLLRIAAVFAIIFGVYFTFFNDDSTKIQTIAAQNKTIALPDASEVFLNAASSLQYNNDTWQKNREVKLKGEAYFKVAKGAKFDVNTKMGTITVLGTQFNVKQRKDYFEVKCFEGLVSVTIKNKSTKLNPGETIRLLDGKIQRNNTSLASPSWINGKSNFESVPFEIVIEEFERQYNTKVTIQNFDTSKIFSGSFVHDNKSLALQSITQPFKLNFEEEENSIKMFTFKND